jgi:hypothetical protein
VGGVDAAGARELKADEWGQTNENERAAISHVAGDLGSALDILTSAF